jgi:hypothetical protein
MEEREKTMSLMQPCWAVRRVVFARLRKAAAKPRVNAVTLHFRSGAASPACAIAGWL